MYNNTFDLKYDDFELLQAKMLDYPNNLEERLTNYIHTVVGDQLAKSITQFIPLGERNSKTKYKTDHARRSTWYKIENKYSLSTSVVNKGGTSWNNGSFYYLYFVETGTGTSKKRGGVDFMERGIDAEYDNVLAGLMDAVENFDL